MRGSGMPSGSQPCDSFSFERKKVILHDFHRPTARAARIP
jgi:hypothetical protein